MRYSFKWNKCSFLKKTLHCPYFSHFTPVHLGTTVLWDTLKQILPYEAVLPRYKEQNSQLFKSAFFRKKVLNSFPNIRF